MRVMFVAFPLVSLSLAILLGVGWVVNIIKIVALLHVSAVTGMLIIRLVGIFCVPLGGVLGWF